MTRPEILRALESHTVALTRTLFAAERAEGAADAKGLRAAAAEMRIAIIHLGSLLGLFEIGVNGIDLTTELTLSIAAVKERKDDVR